MLAAPSTLTTARLVLERPRPTDVPEIFAYASDPEVVRYLSWPRNVSEENTRAFVEWSDAAWRTHGVGPYVIRLATGRIIGSTGLQFLEGRQLPAMTGYVLERASWGHGYATEAVTAMVELARSLGLAELVACCHPEHVVSMRVLEKAGFTHDATQGTLLVFPNLVPGLEQPTLTFVRRF